MRVHALLDFRAVISVPLYAGIINLCVHLVALQTTAFWCNIYVLRFSDSSCA